MARKRKTTIKAFKDIAFSIVNFIDFLDVALNPQSGTYRSQKAANDRLLKIHSPPNDAPQILKQLLNSISEKLSQNPSNQKKINTAKVEYEEVLKKSQSVS